MCEGYLREECSGGSDLPASSHQDPSDSHCQTAATPRKPGGSKVCPLSSIEPMPLVRVISALSLNTFAINSVRELFFSSSVT